MTRWILLAAPLLLFSIASAWALDCKRAATPVEKAICADPAAQIADEAMVRAYEALHKSLDATQRVGLLASQMQWINARGAGCLDLKRPEVGACLAKDTDKRRAFLVGAPDSGPGSTDRLAPFFRYEKGRKGKADVAFELVKFATPSTAGERVFNRNVDKLFEAITEPEADDPAADRYAFTSTMNVTYASPRLLSAHAENWADTGGAHGNPSSTSFNVDLQTGKELTFSELTDKAGAEKVFALCVKQVEQQKIEREGEDGKLDAQALKELRDSVAAATGDLAAWSFSADAASVVYDPYSVGAYAEGAFTCDIPYATLRPLAKPDFPLP